MPRIVSGTGQQVNEALLQGAQLGQQFAAARDRKAQLQQEMQEAALKLNKERAKALEDVNKRAQQGQLQALQQQEMERVAAGLPPEMKRLGEYTALRSTLTDPDVIGELDKSFVEVEKGVQKQKKQESFQQSIQKAGAAGLIDPNEYAVRAQSGEPVDNLTQEIGKKWETEKLARTAEKRNLKDREQAEMLVESLPEGTNERILGETMLSEWDMDVDGQRTPGYGPKKLKELRGLAKGSEELLTQEQIVGGRNAPGLAGMTVDQRNQELGKDPNSLMGRSLLGNALGLDQPDVPPFQPTGPAAHQTRKLPGGDMSSSPLNLPTPKAAKAALPRLVKYLKKSTKDQKAVARKLEEQGFDFNDKEVQTAFLKAFQEADGAGGPK